jgi:hypothetical protein
MDSARSGLSGALSDARGGLGARQTAHHSNARMRGTQVVSKIDELKGKATLQPGAPGTDRT